MRVGGWGKEEGSNRDCKQVVVRDETERETRQAKRHKKRSPNWSRRGFQLTCSFLVGADQVSESRTRGFECWTRYVVSLGTNTSLLIR